MSVVLPAAITDAYGQIIGECTSNADCEDHNICTQDICDNHHRCVYGANFGVPCEPDNHCFGPGLCEGSVCVAQGPYDDCDDENPCTVDGCEYSTGCIHEGETCDDGNPCTKDTCTLPNICSHDQPTNCDDGDPCTLDRCDPSTGCTHQGPNCDDGNPCTIDACHRPGGTCAHDSVDCHDQDSCTLDECDPATGQCSHTERGPCTEDPKSVGYWQRVCRGSGNYSDTITGSDASFIQANSFCMPIPVNSPDDVCQILLLNGVDRCLHAKQEFVALALNLNHGRVSFSDGIDSNCTDNTIVEESFADARHGICLEPCLSEPCFADGGNGCPLAECECREINQGNALHVHGLVATRLANGAVRLSWTAPVADPDALTATPRRYRVWRATDAIGPFVEIAEVADPSFDDTAAVGERFIYDVTPVW